jgi:hypothetical protein
MLHGQPARAPPLQRHTDKPTPIKTTSRKADQNVSGAPHPRAGPCRLDPPGQARRPRGAPGLQGLRRPVPVPWRTPELDAQLSSAVESFFGGQPPAPAAPALHTLYAEDFDVLSAARVAALVPWLSDLRELEVGGAGGDAAAALRALASTAALARLEGVMLRRLTVRDLETAQCLGQIRCRASSPCRSARWGPPRKSGTRCRSAG